MSDKIMTKSMALRVLRDLNDWRRGVGIYDVEKPTEPKYSATDIGLAIDAAIAMLTPCEHTRDRAEQYADAAYAEAKADFNVIGEPSDPYTEGYLDAVDQMIADTFEAGAIYGRQTRATGKA